MSNRVIKNERHFAEWFRENYETMGYSKIIRRDISRFPDFIMLKDGGAVKVELETFASNFVSHKHPIDEVDEIVCLVKDIELAKPIIEVKDVEYSLPQKVTLSIDEDVYRDFREFCEEKGLIISKRMELSMKKIMEGAKVGKKKTKN